MERLLPQESPSSKLESVIEADLRTADLGRIQRKAALLAGLLVASALLLVPVAALMRSELAESGFLSFVSLLFSDWSAVLDSSKEFFITLLESLPVLALALSVGLFSLLLAGIISAARLAHFARGRGVKVGI